MAHARRKFVEALNNDKDRASHALELFQQLYAIERTIKNEGLTDEALLQLRQTKAVPILQALKEWMTAEYPKVLPKSHIGQAIGYCLPRWEKLSIYTTDAVLNIDNNPVENAIRPIAIARITCLPAVMMQHKERPWSILSLPPAAFCQTFTSAFVGS